MKVHDYLPEELKTKYFDFKPRNYPDEKFCSDLLEQIKLSYDNCTYYQDELCKNFDFTIPDELTIEDLKKIPYIPTDLYKKSENLTLNS